MDDIDLDRMLDDRLLEDRLLEDSVRQVAGSFPLVKEARPALN